MELDCLDGGLSDLRSDAYTSAMENDEQPIVTD